MVNYIGWDIGIKNLSYCILDEKCNIIDWGIINLIEEITKIDKCCKITQKGDICDRKVHYINRITNNHYCKIHSKKELNLVEIGKCFEVDCDTNAKVIVTDNKYYCKKHSKTKEVIKTLIKAKSASKESLDVLGRTMINKLDEILDLSEIKTVVIENQPVLKNPKMKSIQMILFTYFLMRNPEINVKLVPASSKLKFNIENEEIDKINKLKNKYTRNKKLAIEYCKEFIKDNTERTKFFVDFKKKDDLADSYLLIRKYLS
tara:strand:- start:273 stop:1052 length:780 start_codon:yes stop_codon:yes gene_type:complete